jgi:hypothetical protein
MKHLRKSLLSLVLVIPLSLAVVVKDAAPSVTAALKSMI